MTPNHEQEIKENKETWSIMCDKCHKFLDREYVKDLIDLINESERKRVLDILDKINIDGVYVNWEELKAQIGKEK